MSETLLQRIQIKTIATLAAWFEPFLFYPRTRGIGPDLPPAPHTGKPRNPVIVVHGVCDSAIGSFNLANSLRRDGWQVFTPTMPGNGMFGAEENGKALAREVKRVLALTGARQVDLVGHSQGGLNIRWFIEVLHGYPYVGRIITLNTPHNGVGANYRKLKAFFNSLGIYRLLPSGLLELVEGSAMLERLDAAHGDALKRGILPQWTSLYSAESDEIVVPYTSPILEGVRNIALVETGNRLFGPDAKGPTHTDANHASVEAYRHLRDALLAKVVARPAKTAPAAART